MELARRVARFVYGRILPRRAYTVLKGPLRGARFVLGSLAGSGGGASVYFGAVEPEQTAAICRELGEGDVFFDIGANVGYYTILASRLVGPAGTVAAFEPVPANLSMLRRHVELNNASNVSVFGVAVSDAAGRSTFTLGADGATGHLGAGELEVETITLDGFAATSSLEPDVLKIDVEGAERAVLMGGAEMFRRVRPKIFLSTHSDELRAWCVARLEGLGYAVSVAGNEYELFARYEGT